LTVSDQYSGSLVKTNYSRMLIITSERMRVVVEVTERMVESAIDRDRVIQWALELAQFSNSRSSETPIAEYLCNELQKLGLRAKIETIAAGRSNAVGVLQGQGGGYTLLFNGHLDFESIRGFTNSESPRVIDDAWVYGPGLANMKSAIAAYLGAVDAIVRSDMELRGDVVIAGVAAGERHSGDNHDDYHPGRQGAGTRYMISHGCIADMCILGEPTALKIVPAHFGKCLIEVVVRPSLDDYENPVIAMKKVLNEIEEWIPQYQAKRMFREVDPPVGITAVRSHSFGDRDMVSAPPAQCDLYIEVRPCPGEHPLEVLDEIRRTVGRVRGLANNIEIGIDMLRAESGHEIGLEAPVSQAVYKAHENVSRSSPEVTYPGWCGDAAYLNRAGIQTVIYGPGGGISRDEAQKLREDVEDLSGVQKIEDLITATKVYALAAVDICGKARI